MLRHMQNTRHFMMITAKKGEETMFEGLKMAADLIKSGVAEAKLWSKLDEMVNKASQEYSKIFTAKQKELYQEYLEKKQACEANTDTDKAQALNEAKEEAEIAFMSLLSKNASLPDDFKKELTALLEELSKSDERAEKVLKRGMLRYAKNDAEKKEVLDAIEESKKQ